MASRPDAPQAPDVLRPRRAAGRSDRGLAAAWDDLEFIPGADAHLPQDADWDGDLVLAAEADAGSTASLYFGCHR